MYIITKTLLVFLAEDYHNLSKDSQSLAITQSKASVACPGATCRSQLKKPSRGLWQRDLSRIWFGLRFEDGFQSLG